MNLEGHLETVVPTLIEVELVRTPNFVEALHGLNRWLGCATSATVEQVSVCSVGFVSTVALSSLAWPTKSVFATIGE
jgi:hypothetical protein